MHQCNWQGVVSDRIYRIPALLIQGTGPDVFGCLCQGTSSLFCHALDLPFTDKGIQAYRLRVRCASGRRYGVSCGVVVVVVVVVVASVAV